MASATPTQQQSLLDAIANDHTEMYSYYDEYVKNAGNADVQGRWARQLTWEVVRHAVSEELVVYPLFEKHLGLKGKQIADNDRADHMKVKELLNELETYDPGSEKHAALLQSVVERLRPHNDNEEKNDLPLLLNAISADDSARAAKSFNRTKKFAPTRAHPGAPDRGPFETVAGLMTAPLDKLKDMFAKFPTEEDKEHARSHQASELPSGVQANEPSVVQANEPSVVQSVN